MLICKSYLYLSENLFTPQLAKKLTVINPEYYKRERNGIPVKGCEPIYILYKKFERDGKIFHRVPRYALGNLSELKDVVYDVGYKEEKIELNKNRKIVPNPSQLSTVKRAIEMLKKEYGCIVEAEMGEGKTGVIASNIISEMGLKTLILVHKDILLDQWKSELLENLELKESDIGLLKAGKFIDGKIVLGSKKSLMRDTIPNDVNKLFGLVIDDEQHLSGAKMYLRALTRFNSKYRLGLTATNYREDKLEKLYQFHMSNNVVKHEAVRIWGQII